MFIIQRSVSKASASAASASAGFAKAPHVAASVFRSTAHILARAIGVLAVAWTALAAGSRMIPLGDNGALLQALSARLYGGLGRNSTERPVDERRV